MNELQTGAVLQNGKYRIEQVLGQGGFGITYLATQTTLGCKVAIKEFFFSDSCTRSGNGHSVSVVTESKKALVDKFRRKFLKEARMLLTISHNNIVRVMDAFEENSTAYYAMEYINGTTLSQYIASNGTLSANETLRIMDTIGQALIYLHSRSINHLDIKPANIMIEAGTQRPLLIDFGVSKQYDPETGQSTTTTPVGVSHGYAPIEQYNNGGVSTFSPQSDIYALGATMLKMLTGTTPPNAVELSQQGGPTLPPSLPHNMACAIRAAMQPVKSKRPQSIQQFLYIMHNGTSGNGSTSEATVMDNNVHKKQKTSTNKVWAAIIAAIFIIGGVAFYTGTNRSSTQQAASTPHDSDTIAKPQEPAAPANVGTTLYAQTEKGGTDDVKLSIDYPTQGPDILLQNIREWINESLGGKYKGDLSDGKALFSHYWDEFLKEKTGEDGYGTYNKVAIKKVYEDSKVVTFTNTSYAYGDGAAHGIETCSGVTFRKQDGRKFTSSLLDGAYKYQAEIKSGLHRYFNSNSDDGQQMSEQQVVEYISNYTNNGSGDIPFPSTDPWITAGGVVFCYPSYEIAPFSDGMPTFTIPTSVVKEKSAATAETFFE